MSLSKESIGFVLGPTLGIVVSFLMVTGGFETPAVIVGGVTSLVVVWWMLEPIPIPVTSLIPLTLFPMLGVLTAQEVAQSYGHHLILLLLGGFILSTAMEKSGAHRRIALNMLRLFGTSSGRRLVLGFMATAALLSMWISNTATTLMLLPVAMAVIDRVKDERISIPLLLGVAHAASVGGIGTPIGTPPNVVFRGVYETVTGTDVGFAQWMLWGVPVVVVTVPLLWLWLTRHINFKLDVELPEVGEWTSAEKRVLTVFCITALAWIFRTQPFGGWTGLFDLPYTNDAMVAFIGVMLMFLVPDGKGSRLLDWETANKIPWGMLILFGAGLSIASAFQSTGLSSSLADTLSTLSVLPTFFMILCICLFVTFLTEATSNTATTTILMPVMAAAAIGLMLDPKLLMVPAAMSASCAFMLPVATPPNVVVFSTGRFPVHRMAKEGLMLNVIGAITISTLCFWYFG